MQLKSYNLVSLNFSCENMKIGILIRDARKRKKLTQEQLAQKVGEKRSIFLELRVMKLIV